MTDRKELEAWIRNHSGNPESDPAVADSMRSSLPVEMIAAYYAGTLDAAEHQRVARAIHDDPENLRILAGIQEDAESATKSLSEELSRPATDGWWDVLASIRWMRPLAAVAGVLFVGFLFTQLWRPLPPGGVPSPYGSPLIERARGGASENSYVTPWGAVIHRVDRDWPLVEPVGDVRDIEWFRWAPLEGAKRYRLEVYFEDGSSLFASSTLQPHARMTRPERRALVPGDYVWMVEAEMRGGVDPIRSVREFSLSPSPNEAPSHR